MQKPRKFKQNKERSLFSGSQKRIERAVLKTLSYRAMFNYPLTFSQLQNYLIVKKPVTSGELSSVLERMVSQKKIKLVNDMYCLKTSGLVDVKSRATNSIELIKKAKSVSTVLKKIPWIKFIGVTGSVAAFNAVEEDDVDILIITQRKRLWLTRGLVFLILRVLGELRKDDKPARKICPNILLDESNLSWSKRNRNIYVANEVVMVYPILDRDNTHVKFLSSNSWVLKIFGNLKFWEFDHPLQEKHKNNILDVVENIGRKSQIEYMKSKKTTEITKDNIIHFNREDHTERFLNEFEKIKTKELK